MGTSDSKLLRSQVPLSLHQSSWFLFSEILISCLMISFFDSLFEMFCTEQPVDEITTVAERIETVDPLLERLRSLKVVSWFFFSRNYLSIILFIFSIILITSR